LAGARRWMLDVGSGAGGAFKHLSVAVTHVVALEPEVAIMIRARWRWTEGPHRLDFCEEPQRGLPFRDDLCREAVATPAHGVRVPLLEDDPKLRQVSPPIPADVVSPVANHVEVASKLGPCEVRTKGVGVRLVDDSVIVAIQRFALERRPAEEDSGGVAE